MFRILPTLTLTLLVCLPSAALLSQPEEERVDEPKPDAHDPDALRVVQKYQDAIGGEAAIQSIDTLVIKGSITEGRNTYQFVRYLKARDKARYERLLETRYGKTPRIITATDGESAWMWDQTADNPYPNPMKGAEARLFQRKARLFGPLVNYEEQNVIFTHEGEDDYRGIPIHRVRAWYGDDDYDWYYFHRDNGLLVLNARKKMFANTPTFIDEVYTKFDKAGGVYFPVRSIRMVQGQKIGSYEVTRIVADKPLDDNVFTMPESEEKWLRQKN